MEAFQPTFPNSTGEESVMANEEKRGDVLQGVSDLMKSWGDAQRSWFQSLLDSATKATAQFKTAGTADTAKTMTEMMGKSFDEGIKRLRQFAPTGPAGEVYEKMLSAQTAYLKAMQWWADAMLQQKAGVPLDPKALVELWSRSYNEFLTSIVVPPFAGPLKMWLGAAEGGGLPLPVGEYAQALSQAGKQWMDFVTRMGERTGEVLRGEVKPEAAKELYESWLRGYEETLGRLFKVPPVGPARQLVDRHMRGMDSFMKYQAALTDFYGKMVQPGMEALNELAGKTQELSQGPVTGETFEKFYQLLLKTVEQRFYELFKSPPFLSALENTLQSSLDFYGQMNSLVEEQLKGTPIVTRKELDDVLKELHDIKRELRATKKE
jgi:hypothetical protein